MRRMDNRRRVVCLLETADWGEDATLIDSLKRWRHYPMVLDMFKRVRVDALYKSPVHGSGHINRVLLMAALIAYQEDLDETLLRAYLLSCSYHDVGRTFDGLDLEHGARSAEQLADLTGCEGELLLEMQAAVTVHSQPDAKMDLLLAGFAAEDPMRMRRLACLLKDADNLDRVRLGDLKPEFLRSESAKRLVDFSMRLLALDQALKRRIANE